MSEMETFESQLKKLEETVTLLERGELPLEESLKAFEGGMGLVKECKDYLDSLSLRVEKIVGMQGGVADIETLDADEL